MNLEIQSKGGNGKFITSFSDRKVTETPKKNLLFVGNSKYITPGWMSPNDLPQCLKHAYVIYKLVKKKLGLIFNSCEEPQVKMCLTVDAPRIAVCDAFYEAKDALRSVAFPAARAKNWKVCGSSHELNIKSNFFFTSLYITYACFKHWGNIIWLFLWFSSQGYCTQ